MALPFTFSALTLISSTQVNANFIYLDAAVAGVSGALAGKLTAANNLSDLTNASAARSSLGLGSAALATTGTSGHTVGFLDGANTWGAAQTFSVAPVFTDQSGSRSALGLGTVATLTSGVATGNLSPVATGAVLQEVVVTDAGATTTNTSLAALNVSVVNITPKSAASQLLVSVTFQGSSQLLASTNTSATFQLYDFTNSANIGQQVVLGISTGSGANADQSPCSLSAIVSNTVVTSRAFEIRGFTNNAGSAAGAQSMVWSIREIKT